MLVKETKQIKKFELRHDEYIVVEDRGSKSYGGNQQWFSQRLGYGRAARTHRAGCGLIALSDLFLYWGKHLDEFGEGAPGAQLVAEAGKLNKEDYMAYVEHIRDHYVGILTRRGMLDLQLILTVNYYCLRHRIPYKAYWKGCMDDRSMLKEICRMLKEDIPVVLLISSPFPGELYKILFKNKKVGIPFYKKERNGTFTVVYPKINSHYITVTGAYIDKTAQKKEKVMLRISSWGTEYYISYYEYCKYVFKHGVDIESRILCIK